MDKKKRASQSEVLLKEMKIRKKKGVTSMDGLRLGIAHVPSVIRQLKKQGVKISSERIYPEDSPNWYTLYWLTK